MKKVLPIVLVMSVMTGCSSLKYSQDFEMKAPSFDGSKPAEGDEVKYPSWYKTEKEPKKDTLYAVASEFSKDFQFAVDKSMLSAKRELASQYSSHVSSMMKNFTSEIGETGSVVREIDQTTKLVVAQVNLVGVNRDNMEVRHERDGYRAFVKLSYTTTEANRILLENIKRNRQLNAKLEKSKAFKELEQNVNTINEQGTVQQ